jgi:hypothetical protein
MQIANNPEAILLQHKDAPDPPATLRFFVNLFMMPISEWRFVGQPLECMRGGRPLFESAPRFRIGKRGWGLGRSLRGCPYPPSALGAMCHGSVFYVRLDRTGECRRLPGLRHGTQTRERSGGRSRSTGAPNSGSTPSRSGPCASSACFANAGTYCRSSVNAPSRRVVVSRSVFGRVRSLNYWAL